MRMTCLSMLSCEVFCVRELLCNCAGYLSRFARDV